MPIPNPLSGVRTWLYVIQGVGPAKMDEIGAAPVDMVVVDQSRPSGNAYSAADVIRMQGDNDKLVMSYLSIGEAEDYRNYWQADWDLNKPAFLGPENPEWAGNYKVRYWRADWQQIVFTMIDKIVDSGFNGLYLDIIDAFQYWEERAPRANADFYRDAMVDFVAAVRAHALARLAEIGAAGRDFAILGQNGLDLLSDPAYRDAIDGVGAEDAYFYYPNGSAGSFAETSAGWRAQAKHWLQVAESHGVESFLIEYVPAKFRDKAIAAVREEIATLTNPLDTPLYLSTSRALDRVELSIDGDGRVWHWGTAGGDSLKGTPWRDFIRGYAGNDSLSGYAGNDRLVGGEGNDALAGGNGNDRLFGGGGGDRLYGGLKNDLLFGGPGNDRLFGGAGADRLDAGPGTDQATGGWGADTFLFHPDDGSLRITDFGKGADRIDLSDFGLSGFSALRQMSHLDHGDTIITLGNDTLILEGTRPAELTAADFLL